MHERLLLLAFGMLGMRLKMQIQCVGLFFFVILHPHFVSVHKQDFNMLHPNDKRVSMEALKNQDVKAENTSVTLH